MANPLSKSCFPAALVLSLAIPASLRAAEPTVAEALAFQPVQRDVQYDRPTAAEAARCTIAPEKTAGKNGWVVRDAGGQILRNFVDTNGDKAVDQWCYFKDGLEVYRDIDSNSNRKVDQYRWLNTAGTRWGADINEDTRIDYWKMISPEEVTAELVAAVRDRDRSRFERLLLSPKELKALGLAGNRAQLLEKKIDGAPAAFAKAVAQQKVITPETRWVSFGGNTPGVVPAGTDGLASDIMVYENVMAMIENGGKAQAIGVGTLVRVGAAWRMVDVPHLSEDLANAAETKPIFFGIAQGERPDAQLARPNEKIQPLLEELHKLGEISPDDKPETHDRRAELLEKIASEADAEQRPTWYRQLADTLSAAVQSGGYPGGIERLKALHEKLAADEKEEQLAFYVQYRALTAEHSQALSDPDGKFEQIQAKWVADLKKFVEAGNKNPDSADAMMELAMAQELNGNEPEALRWYEQIIKDFPKSPNHRKAEGARLRLTCEGGPIPLAGKTITGTNFDLSQLKGKVVLIQYWATWCEPCKSDMPLLTGLRTKYKGFEVVGVCLDNDKKDMLAFLRENDPHWTQLYEEGGLDGRYATMLGIQTLPMMILIDKQGKVVSRNISGQLLDGELRKLLK